jgi:hypothetical protein
MDGGVEGGEKLWRVLQHSFTMERGEVCVGEVPGIEKFDDI